MNTSADIELGDAATTTAALKERIQAEVNAFIAKYESREPSEWTEFFKQETRILEKFKDPSLNSPDLGITLIQCRRQTSPGTDVITKRRIRNFSELFDYLDQEPDQSLSHEVISILHYAGIPAKVWYAEWQGHVEVATLEFRIRQIASTALFAILSNRWNIGFADTIRLLGLVDDFGPFCDNLENQLPSSGKKTIAAQHFARIATLETPSIPRSDASIDTTRLHCMPPRTTFINSLCLSSENTEIPYKYIFSSKRLKYEDNDAEDQSVSGLFPCVSGLPEESEGGNGRWPGFYLAAVERKSLETHYKIIQDLKSSVQQMMYGGRSSPSVAKLNWLTYALDCARIISQSAKAIGSYPNTWPGRTYEVANWMNSFLKDREAVLDAVGRLQNESLEIKKMVKESLELSTSYRATLLTVLAALYVPLSFTTGIFGMNLAEINQSTPSYKQVLCVGIPLTALTVVIPLVMGSIYRGFFRAMEKLRGSSHGLIIIRGLTILLSLATLVSSVTSFIFAASEEPEESGASRDMVLYYISIAWLSALILVHIWAIIVDWSLKRSKFAIRFVFLSSLVASLICALLLPVSIGRIILLITSGLNFCAQSIRALRLYWCMLREAPYL